MARTSTKNSAPRLWLESPSGPRSVVRGCWWLRSTDPATELPGLVLALDELGAPVVRLGSARRAGAHVRTTSRWPAGR